MVLRGEDCPEEPPDRSRVREDTPTSVRRLISLLRRSSGLFDQTCLQWATVKGVKAPIRAKSIAPPTAPLTPYLAARIHPPVTWGDSSRQRFLLFVFVRSAVYPSFRSDGASRVRCFPVSAPLEGQDLGLLPSC